MNNKPRALARVHTHAHTHSTYNKIISWIPSSDSAIFEYSDCVLSVVAFCDLSAAFDTLNHQIMLKRLSVYHGIQGKALQWLSSYLSGCQQSVIIGKISSKPVSLQFVVTQGSVLGLILFILNTQRLLNIIKKNISLTIINMQMTEYQKAAPPSDFS